MKKYNWFSCSSCASSSSSSATSFDEKQYYCGGQLCAGCEYFACPTSSVKHNPTSSVKHNPTPTSTKPFVSTDYRWFDDGFDTDDDEDGNIGENVDDEYIAKDDEYIAEDDDEDNFSTAPSSSSGSSPSVKCGCCSHAETCYDCADETLPSLKNLENYDRKCCKKNCSNKLGNFEEVYELILRYTHFPFYPFLLLLNYIIYYLLVIIYSYRRERRFQSPREKYNEVLNTVKNSISSISDKSQVTLEFRLVINSRSVKVCRNLFRKFADISESGLNRIIVRAKLENSISTNASSAFGISDTSSIEKEVSPRDLKEFLAEFYKIEISDRDLALIGVSTRSTRSKALYHWFDKFITSASCVNPVDGKLQIEMCGFNELYLIYCADMKLFKESYVGVNYFKHFFKTVFPYVQIRKKKSVTGKCQICAILSQLRLSCKSGLEIEAVSRLHALHKLGFMGERRAYYERRSLGFELPTKFMSLITDGMAQMHCILPWTKGLSQNVDLCQHLQGTYVHGKGIYIYRTFNNIKVSLSHVR